MTCMSSITLEISNQYLFIYLFILQRHFCESIATVSKAMPHCALCYLELSLFLSSFSAPSLAHVINGQKQRLNSVSLCIHIRNTTSLHQFLTSNPTLKIVQNIFLCICNSTQIMTTLAVVIMNVSLFPLYLTQLPLYLSSLHTDTPSSFSVPTSLIISYPMCKMSLPCSGPYSSGLATIFSENPSQPVQTLVPQSKLSFHPEPSTETPLILRLGFLHSKTPWCIYSLLTCHLTFTTLTSGCNPTQL